jgi:hypothetical protein
VQDCRWSKLGLFVIAAIDIERRSAEVGSMTLKDYLGFTVIAAFVTFLGNMVALYLKDYLGARSFELWKSKRSLAALYDKYRRPISMAARELSGRCYAISVNRSDGPRGHIGTEMLRKTKKKSDLSSVVDDHFFRYRFVSDVYRLCCFLGWIELYRRDLGLLDAGDEPQTKDLDACLDKIRADLADGQINTSDDWHSWIDALVFREEQRAIGFRMISASMEAGVMDFGTFCEQLEKDADGVDGARWFLLAARFFSNLEEEKDFRIVRMKRLVVHLTELQKLLQPHSIFPPHLQGAQALAEELKSAGYLGLNER